MRNELDDIVMRHLPLAKKLGRKFGRGRDDDDMIGVANIGLVKAAFAYRPDKGATFGAFARRVVVNEIFDYLRACRAASAPPQRPAPEPTVLPKIWKVDLSTNDDIKIDQTGRVILTDGFSAEESLIEDQSLSIWTKRLTAALAVLDPRERAIYTARHLIETPETLLALALKFDVSLERIRQIDVAASARVQRLIARPNAGARFFRMPSRAARLQRETDAMAPAKDRNDNIIRRAVSATLSVGRGDENAAVMERARLAMLARDGWPGLGAAGIAA